MTEFGGIIIILIVLVIHFVASSLMRSVAIQKGYGDDIHAWAVCFWLGLFGYLYVIALPDKILQSQNQQIIELLKEEKE